MKKLLIWCCVILFCQGAKSQQNCRRTSVYFENDAYDLSDAAKKKIDSLVSHSYGNEFMVELYGHADSSATTAYNLTLANNRMSEVKKYMNQKSSANLQFREKNFGETNVIVSRTSDVNLAFNRRVDIYVVPMNNGKLVVTGARNENVEVPADYFEPCGICNGTAAPSVKGYYNQEDGNDANIVMQTNDGVQLTTAGTITMNFNPCNGKKDTTTFVIRVCTDQIDTAMRVWVADTVNGKIYWKETNTKPFFDAVSGCYVMRGRGAMNLDKKPAPSWKYDYVIILPQEYKFKRSALADSRTVRRKLPKEDTITLAQTDSVYYIRGFAAMNGNYYMLNIPIDSLPSMRTTANLEVSKTYYVAADKYDPFTKTDTALMVHFRKSMKAESFGYYLKDYNMFIPVTQGDGMNFLDSKPATPCQYGYMKKGKLYVINNKKVKPKYDKKKQAVVLKFGKRSRKNFHSVSNFEIAPKA